MTERKNTAQPKQDTSSAKYSEQRTPEMDTEENTDLKIADDDSADSDTPDDSEAKCTTKRKRRKFKDLDRPFVCDIAKCGRPYATEHSLNQHIRLKHQAKTTSERRMSCPINVQLRPGSDLLPETSQIAGPFPVRRQATHPRGPISHSVNPGHPGHDVHPGHPGPPAQPRPSGPPGPPGPPGHTFNRSYRPRPPPRLYPYIGEHRVRYPERAESSLQGAYPPYLHTDREPPESGYHPRHSYHGYGPRERLYRDFRPHVFREHGEWAEYRQHIHGGVGLVRELHAGAPALSAGSWPTSNGMRRSHSGRAMAGQRVKENPLETAVPRSRPHRANVYRRRASLQRRESTNSSFNPFGRDSHAHLDNSPISLTLDDTNYQVATPSEHTSQIHTFTTAQKSAQELSLTKVAKGVKENALTGRGIRMSSGNADKPCLNPALLIDGECGTTSDSWQSLHDADIQNPSGMLLDSIIESGEYITSLENTKDDSVARQAVSDAAEELELRTEASNIILSTANAISFLAKVTEKTVNTDSQLSSISRTSTNSSTMNGFDNQFYSMGSTERLFSGRSESTANNETDMDYTQDISLFAGVSSFPANDMVSPAVDDTAFCTWIPDKFDFDDIIDASEYVFATNFRDAELNQNMKSEQDVTPIADSV